MSSDMLKPDAAVTIGLRGLAVCFHNQSFNKGRGRWEIAIPRFDDHVLRMDIDDLGIFTIDRTVKSIEIKDRESVPTAPKHGIEGKLDRKNKTENPNDYQWVTSFGEVPEHKTVVPKPDGVAVTMLYVYDAIAYTKSIDSTALIRSNLVETAPLTNGKPDKVPDATLIPILNNTEDSFFEARIVGMDIESAGGDAVDILIDAVDIPIENAKKLTVPHKDQPQKIMISNLEPPPRTLEEIKEIVAKRFIATDEFNYGLGDFYRYYELFDVGEQKIHQWGKQPIDEFGANADCCCNPVGTP